MPQQKWTWEKIKAEKDNMTEAELDKAIDSMFPKDIEAITDKLDAGQDLTEAEELRLEQWENSPDSGVAGGLMGGHALKSTG